ncbi:DNA gyrase inhibitor YacG [Rhodobacter sp. SGA-6-6]|uniref:DNA gyrase inhibitor YacG n=1 Tax=Rhodobacter sp. SGA-6-6 TaxID=2710882 RepID=UPI0013ED621C|nr:DNA gyrase inhibitor YacG [Rhodobacter sp. SGA-6-6]
MTQAAPCPICGKPSEPRYRPFCSRRCADVDLARWLNESYRIPDEAAGEDDALPDFDGETPPTGKPPH